MKEVLFPAIGLKLELMPIAFTIGGMDIYWYSILIVLAIGIALLCFKKQDGKYGIKFQDIMDLSIYLIPIAFISARLYYVIFNFEPFRENPIQILNFRTGGLAIYGGIIGGIVTCLIFCRKRKIKLLDLFDFIVPCLALGQAIGRWGNFINVEAYGEITNLPWRMGIWQNGIYQEVHPTFLYESICTFSICIFLYHMGKKRKYTGQITYWYLILYSFARMWIEGLRTDSLMFQNIRISQLVSITLFVVFCIIVLYNEIKLHKSASNGEK